MDTLSVSTLRTDDGGFNVRYRFVQEGGKLASVAGVVSVVLADRPDWQEDRAILAELAALHFLLEVRQVHGANRLGNGLRLDVSSGAIRKAVAKGALKKNDAGTTSRVHVAHFCQFLATKFFEATVEVVPPGKWSEMESRRESNEAITVETWPDASIVSALGKVVVRRHALNRFVERCMVPEEIAAGASLVDIPDYRWTRAWRALEKIVPQADAVQVPPKEAQRITRKYGADVHVLSHSSSQSVLILKKEPSGDYSLVTVLRGNDDCKLIELPRVAGQRLIYTG
jgi:hypothetical protein